MKSLVKVLGINSQEDVTKIREAISAHEGVVACEINTSKGEVSLVYDDKSATLEKIVNSIELQGYTIA